MTPGAYAFIAFFVVLLGWIPLSLRQLHAPRSRRLYVELARTALVMTVPSAFFGLAIAAGLVFYPELMERLNRGQLLLPTRFAALGTVTLVGGCLVLAWRLTRRTVPETSPACASS